MEFWRRGPATAAADGDVSDGRRFRDPPSHGDSMLVIRDALQAQLQKDRLRREIIEVELAKIDRAMALSCISDKQQPVSYSFAEEFMPHRGFSSAAHDPKKKDERRGSLELKPWKPVTEYRLTECSTDGKAGQESKLHESDETKLLDETYTEMTLLVKLPKAPERWSGTVCQVEATSEHNLQEHFTGQKHQANVASSESRNNGGRHQTPIRALQQEESKSTAMNYVHQRPPSAWGKLPLNGSNSNIVGSEMARHMISLYFCKVCNLQCSNEFMFEQHRRGKKHRGNLWKNKVMTFCKVCNLQCNNEQMLADHLTGKKHEKNARAVLV